MLYAGGGGSGGNQLAATTQPVHASGEPAQRSAAQPARHLTHLVGLEACELHVCQHIKPPAHIQALLQQGEAQGRGGGAVWLLCAC